MNFVISDIVTIFFLYFNSELRVKEAVSQLKTKFETKEISFEQALVEFEKAVTILESYER